MLLTAFALQSKINLLQSTSPLVMEEILRDWPPSKLIVKKILLIGIDLRVDSKDESLNV